MKKIIFLINTLSVGGAERVLVNIANNLNKNEFEVTIKTIFPDDDFVYLLSKDVKHETIIKSKNKLYNTLIYKLFCKILSGKILHKLFIKNNYDIEVAFLEGLPTKIISNSSSIARKVSWVHTNLDEYRGSDYSFNNELSQIMAYSKFDKIIFVSDSVCKAFIKRFGEISSMEVVHNPIDCEDIIKKASINISHPSTAGFQFVSVGRLVKQKGFDRLIDAVHKLKMDGINAKLMIIGEGVVRKELEELIKLRGSQDYIELLGYQKNPYSIMKKADAFVLSSYVEGYPSVLIEALILNIPIISVNCEGVEEILEDDLGLIVENTTDAIYEGMKEFVLNPDKYNYYKQKNSSKDMKFIIEDRINDIENLFNE